MRDFLARTQPAHVQRRLIAADRKAFEEQRWPPPVIEKRRMKILFANKNFSTQRSWLT